MQLTYSGVVIGVAFSFLSIMGSDADKHFIARRGAVYGGIIFMIMLFLLNAGMLAVLDEANHVALPTLVMANAIHPVFGTIFINHYYFTDLQYSCRLNVCFPGPLYSALF